MRRLFLILAVIAVLTGCVPDFFQGEQGWWQARGGNQQPIRVAPIPKYHAFSDFDVIAPWNWTAGWQLFAIDTVNPQVTFVATTPICPNNNCADRRAAWVQRHTSPDGWLHHVTIHVDPELAWQLDVYTMQHELHHALSLAGTECDSGYRGVGAHCEFWERPPQGWWQGDDVQMLRNTGYRTN